MKMSMLNNQMTRYNYIFTRIKSCFLLNKYV